MEHISQTPFPKCLETTIKEEEETLQETGFREDPIERVFVRHDRTATLMYL